MTRNEILSKLAALFEARPEQLTSDAGPGQIPGWDSLADLGVISLLDDAGAGEITAENAASFTTVGAILSFAAARKLLVD